MTLGEQIRQARENKNLSQEELASRLGVSHQAVSKWENDASVPHGINREMLSKLLELEVFAGEESTAGKQSRIMWLGWGIAAVFALLLGVSLWFQFRPGTGEDNMEGNPFSDTHASPSESGTDREGADQKDSQKDTEKIHTIKSVRFYDSHQNVVEEDGGWYNSAGFDSILIQWEGTEPSNIKIFYTPTGTEMEEQTELRLTKSILYGGSAALLSADVLKEDSTMGHVYFELDYGTSKVVSDIYNIIHDPDFVE